MNMSVTQQESASQSAAAAYKDGNFSDALSIWREAASAGDVEAMSWIGACYANGDGVELDDAEALKWYTQAAELGNALAQANVGAFHYMGRGTQKDANKAVEWLERASEGNDLNGLFNLAQLYTHGDGIAEDKPRAADLYRKAAELGHYPSQSRLGYMYAQGDGIKKDRVQAYLWLTLASQHGIGTALDALEAVIKEMSSEEKAEGAQLFDEWRFRTKSAEGPVALYPTPS